MSQAEMMKLQGMDPARLKLPPHGVTSRQLSLAVGNAFTVTVFEALLAEVIACMSIL